MTHPEILGVPALVWLQLDEEPLLEIAGFRLDILSFRAREELGWEDTGQTGSLTPLEGL